MSEKKYCALFAGQSVQETGMGRALWKIPAARRVLERLKPSLGADLEDITTSMGETELALTYNAQRAIHACHLGHWFAYLDRHPGLTLDGACGHSLGVVAALVAAGALSVEDSGVFVAARAKAFSEVCASFPEPMGLAAIATDYLDDWVDKINSFSGVSLALHNTVGRGVIGGSLANLEKFSAHAAEQGWPVKLKILKVEGPYHTSALAPCKPALKAALSGAAIVSPAVPVFMGTSGQAESDPERISALLVDQADSRERHFSAIWAAYDGGCRNFLEIAYRPQPVTWISDQLIDEDGGALSDVSTTAVKTDEILGLG